MVVMHCDDGTSARALPSGTMYDCSLGRLSPNISGMPRIFWLHQIRRPAACVQRVFLVSKAVPAHTVNLHGDACAGHELSIERAAGSF